MKQSVVWVYGKNRVQGLEQGTAFILRSELLAGILECWNEYKYRTRKEHVQLVASSIPSILLSNSSHSRDGSKVTFSIHHHLPPLSPPMRHALGSVASKSRPCTRICDAHNPTLVLYYSYCPSLSFSPPITICPLLPFLHQCRGPGVSIQTSHQCRPATPRITR